MKLDRLTIPTKRMEAYNFGGMELNVEFSPVTSKQREYMLSMLYGRIKVSVQISQAERRAIDSMISPQSFGYIKQCSLDIVLGVPTGHLRIAITEGLSHAIS